MVFGRWVIPCGAGKAAKGGRASFPSRGEFTEEWCLSGGSGNAIFLQKEKELIPAVLSSPPPTSSSITPKGHPGYRTLIPLLPFPLRSCPAVWLQAGERGGHRKPLELRPQPRAPRPRGQQSPGITPLPRCAACAVARSSSRARAALMLELAPLLLPGSGTGNPIPAFIWRQCQQPGE